MVVLLLCTGCSFRRHVAGMAIEHNDFVAQTTNRQTVLNILRASQREPMHFTSFSSVSGKAQGTGQIGLNSSLGGDGGSLAQTDSIATKAGPTGAFTEATVTDTVVDTLTRGVNNLTPSAQVSVTTGTDFTIGVNATEEFYRGIMGPLSPGIIVYYLRQGFPSDLLSHLVIRRIEFRARITRPDKTEHMIPLGAYDNSPDERGEARSEQERRDAMAFEEALRCWQLSYSLNRAPAATVPAPTIENLTGLDPDLIGRLRRHEDEEGEVTYQLEISAARTEFGLALANTGHAECRKDAEFREIVHNWALGEPVAVREEAEPSADASARRGRGIVAQTLAPLAPDNEEITQGVGGSGAETLYSESTYFREELPPGYKGELVIDLTLRSVEGILYYLGEYVRNQNTSPRLRYRTCPSTTAYCLPIIRVLRASEVPASARFTDVSYRGRSYAVPIAGHPLDQPGGRSSQVISLVQQLLNLHRSSRDLPGTALVRVTN